MTGNAQVDHRKNVRKNYIDHRGGQFESLQSVPIRSEENTVNWKILQGSRLKD